MSQPIEEKLNTVASLHGINFEKLKQAYHIYTTANLLFNTFYNEIMSEIAKFEDIGKVSHDDVQSMRLDDFICNNCGCSHETCMCNEEV